MKNVFVFIAVFFGAFTLSLIIGAVFVLYGNKTAQYISFSVSAVFFICFVITVITGYVSSVKGKEKKDGEGDKNHEDKK